MWNKIHVVETACVKIGSEALFISAQLVLEFENPHFCTFLFKVLIKSTSTKHLFVLFYIMYDMDFVRFHAKMNIKSILSNTY